MKGCGESDKDGWNGGEENADEKVAVTEPLLKLSADHSRQHHIQPHQGGGEGVVGGAIFSRGDLLHHIDGETDNTHAPEELLDADTGRNEGIRRWAGQAEEEKDYVGDIEAQTEKKKALFETPSGDKDAPEDGADHEGACSEGAVDISQGLVG